MSLIIPIFDQKSIPKVAVDIVQQKVKMDEFIYGITLRKANARSNACFCLTHAAFQELVAAAPSLDQLSA